LAALVLATVGAAQTAVPNLAKPSASAVHFTVLSTAGGFAGKPAFVD